MFAQFPLANGEKMAVNVHNVELVRTNGKSESCIVRFKSNYEIEVGWDYDNTVDFIATVKEQGIEAANKEFHVEQSEKYEWGKITDDDLESLYQKYPRKVGKKRGMQKMKSQIKSMKKFRLLEKAIYNYSQFIIGSDQTYVKHFSTFMGEWEDWIEMPETPAQNKGQKLVEQNPYIDFDEDGEWQ